MGWDAFAFKGDKCVFEMHGNNAIKKKFVNASNGIKRRKIIVDGGLKYGVLGCSGAGLALQQAVGFSVYQDWNEDQVKARHKIANWNFIASGNCDEGDIESAKEFLRVCSENGLKIIFSY